MSDDERSLSAFSISGDAANELRLIKPHKIEEEFGDVLFALVNYARFVHVDPEHALEKTNKKFIRRFQHIESMALQTGKSLHDMTLEEMDQLWNKAKEEEQH